jgi:hypothetical protein
MSLWHTLHLLHYPTFETEVLGTMRQGGTRLHVAFKEYLEEYEPRIIRGKTAEEAEQLMQAAVSEIHSIAQGFDEAFRKHQPYNSLPDWQGQRAYLDGLEWGYDGSKFFEWMVFKHAADFFPHIPMGKRSLFHHLDVRAGSIAYEVLEQFSERNFLLCGDDRGIIQWLTPAETEMLSLDKHLLTASDPDFLATFLRFLQIAVDHGLGMIQGLEMAETQLERLPTFKIVPQAVWHDFQSPYLLFER